MKAVLFDMDGVLSNTEPHHVKAFAELFKRHKIRLAQKDMNDIFGKLDEQIISEICKKKKKPCPIYKWGKEKRKIVVELLKHSTIRSFPDAVLLVKKLKQKKKLGIGTSSSAKEVEVILSRLKLRKYFDAVMGREDVRTHKPSPELYRKLAKRLKVKPSECVVIEDSVTGVEAAKRANMKCIAVLDSFPASKLKKADLTVKSLKDKRVLKLIK